MKAVVLEVRDGAAAVLREDGTVEKLRRDCRVGETVEVEEPGRIVRFPGRTSKWVAAAAAALIVLSAGGTYGYNNAYAYSYVTLDANPSIEYVLNRKNQVISVTALNEDGEELVSELSDVKRQSLTYAIAETTDILYAEDYLGEDRENCVLISVSSRGEAQQAALTEEVDAFFAARAEQQENDLTVYVTNADRSDREKADALGVSAGRYVVIRDIAGRDGGPGELTPEDIDRFGAESVGSLLERGGMKPAPNGEKSAPPPADSAPAEVRNGEQDPGATREPEAQTAPAVVTDAPAAGTDIPSEGPDAALPAEGERPEASVEFSGEQRADFSPGGGVPQSGEPSFEGGGVSSGEPSA